MCDIGTPAARRVAVGVTSMTRSTLTPGARNSGGMTSGKVAARRPAERRAALGTVVTTVHSFALFSFTERATSILSARFIQIRSKTFISAATARDDPEYGDWLAKAVVQSKAMKYYLRFYNL